MTMWTTSIDLNIDASTSDKPILANEASNESLLPRVLQNEYSHNVSKFYNKESTFSRKVIVEPPKTMANCHACLPILLPKNYDEFIM